MFSKNSWLTRNWKLHKVTTVIHCAAELLINYFAAWHQVSWWKELHRAETHMPSDRNQFLFCHSIQNPLANVCCSRQWKGWSQLPDAGWNKIAKRYIMQCRNMMEHAWTFLTFSYTVIICKKIIHHFLVRTKARMITHDRWHVKSCKKHQTAKSWYNCFSLSVKLLNDLIVRTPLSSRLERSSTARSNPWMAGWDFKQPEATLQAKRKSSSEMVDNVPARRWFPKDRAFFVASLVNECALMSKHSITTSVMKSAIVSLVWEAVIVPKLARTHRWSSSSERSIRLSKCKRLHEIRLYQLCCLYFSQSCSSSSGL